MRRKLALKGSHAMAANTQASDEVLIQQYYACDDAAFNELYARYWRKLHAFFVLCCRDAARAEDLVQETLIKIVCTKADNQARFQPGHAKFRTWLYKVALNVWRDAVRRERPTKSLPEDEGKENDKGPCSSGTESVRDSRPGPEELASINELLDVLADCLGNLTDSRRDAVILVYQLGFTAEEAGVIMGKEANAVFQLLHNAIKYLRECLRNHGYTSLQEIDPDTLKTAMANRLKEVISMLGSETKIRINRRQQTQRRPEKGTEYEQR